MSDIDEATFRDAAKKAIDKYADKGMLLDVILWGRIVGLYEQRIAELEEERTTLRKLARDYVVTQAHHMSDSWRDWFRKGFGLDEAPPYGLTLRSEWKGPEVKPR